jgi:hypothetical protein
MIARTWTGTVRRSDADEYAGYIRETGFAEYGQTPGNRGAWMLRRDEAALAAGAWLRPQAAQKPAEPRLRKIHSSAGCKQRYSRSAWK